MTLINLGEKNPNLVIFFFFAINSTLASFLIRQEMHDPLYL